MKKILSTITILVPVLGWSFPQSAVYKPIPGHVCDNSAFTVLVIAEEQPRSILAWVKDAVFLDETALVEVGSTSILIHGKSTIFMPPLYWDLEGRPFLPCDPRVLEQEATAHGYIFDGVISQNLENFLRMYQPDDPKFKPEAYQIPESPPIKPVSRSWDEILREVWPVREGIADGRP